MKPRRIDLYLDRLVLEGVAPEHRSRVVASLERELLRRLGRGELPRGSRAGIASERPGEHAPERLGAEVARAITKGGEP